VSSTDTELKVQSTTQFSVCLGHRFESTT
jgi:hypothetical protein